MRQCDGEARGDANFHSGRNVTNGKQMDALDEFLVQNRCFASLKGVFVGVPGVCCDMCHCRKTTVADARFQTVKNRVYR
jgi:hypothetical protein